MWVKQEGYCWLSPDDYTFIFDGCVIIREPILDRDTLFRPVSLSIHECDRHRGENAINVRWPDIRLQINKIQGPQAMIAGAFDRNETQGELP